MHWIVLQPLCLRPARAYLVEAPRKVVNARTTTVLHPIAWERQRQNTCFRFRGNVLPGFTCKITVTLALSRTFQPIGSLLGAGYRATLGNLTGSTLRPRCWADPISYRTRPSPQMRSLPAASSSAKPVPHQHTSISPSYVPPHTYVATARAVRHEHPLPRNGPYVVVASPHHQDSHAFRPPAFNFPVAVHHLKLGMPLA